MKRKELDNLPIDQDTMKLIYGIFPDAPIWYHVKLNRRGRKKNE